MSGYRNIQVLLSANTGDLKRGLLEGSRAVQRFESDVKRANASQSALAGGLKAGLAVGATAVAVGLGYAVTKAAEFDKQMRNVNSLTGLSEKNFGALEKQVISMSKRLPQSAATLAEGLYDIASSGYQGADGLKVLEASAQAASAGLSTTGTAAQAITGVLNAYGLTANDAADVSDILFQTVNLGVVSFDELAGSIGNVIGGAAAAKISIDQVGASIATMTLAGIGGAEATTSLNNLIAKLVQPSEALAHVYKSLGYESGASALKTKGLHGVMEDLRKSTGGNIEALLEMFPEIRAARGALALMANEGKNYNKVSDQIEDKHKRQGATLRTLKEQMKAVSNQWEVFKNKADAAAITLGLKVLPSITKAMSGMEDFGKGVADVLDTLAPLQSAAEAVGHAIMAIGGFLEPTVEALAKLAGTAAIGAVLALGKALEVTANFMADHEQIVTMLAIAYGVKLLGALIAARGGLSVMAWQAFGTVLVGLLGKADAASAAFARLKVAQSLATLGIAGIIAAGMSAWNGYNEGTKEAEEATKRANDAMRATDFGAVKKGAAEATASVAEMWATINAQGDKNFLQRTFDPGGNAKTLALIKSIDDVEAAATKVNGRMQDMRGNTLRYLTESTRLTGGAIDKWLQPILNDTGKLDGEVSKLSARAKAAGVDLAGPYDLVKAKLDAFARSQAGAVSAEQAVIDAMGGMGSKATDVASQVDDLKQSLDRLMGVPMNMDEAADQFEESLDKMTAALKKNGHTLDNNTEKGRANKAAIRDAVKDLRGKIEAEAAAGKSAKELSTTLTDGIAALYSNGRAAGWTKTQMSDLLTQYNLTPELVSTIVQAVGTGKSEAEVKALIKTMGGVKPTTVQVIAKGAAKSRTDVKNLDGQIALLKNKVVSIQEFGATAAKGEVASLKKQIAVLEGKRVAIGVLGADLGAAQVSALRQQIALLHDKDVKVRYVVSGKDTGGGSTANADGNILSFADGGQYRAAIGDQQPQIASNQGPRGIQWAETGSGPWEAFISGHPGKRKRSIGILARTADMLGGLSVVGPDGQPVEAFASGGIRTRPGLAARKGETQADYNQRYAEYVDARLAREAAARENARLYAEARGRGANSLQASWSGAGALGEYSRRSEAMNQAGAQRRANLTGNQHDTAADYYKDPVLTAKGMATNLAAQTASVRKWSADLSKIAHFTGGDVAKSLESMGEDGKKYVDAMSRATVSDMKKMASELRKLEFAKALGDTTADVKAQAAFQTNLMSLVKSGRADLAAQFASMGVDQAGTLAAAAVAATPAQRAALASNYAALQQQPSTDALKLAGLLQGSGGKLGVVGLARAGGMGLADVLGLLEGHKADVFGPLAGTGAMRQVLLDQALMAAGKQPSGLANGGIVLGGHNKGQFYRWAEEGQGGESLIPLGMDKRARAQALWQTTGRMIGAMPQMAAGAGATYINVAQGAVAVSVTVPGTSATPAQIQAAATAAANSAIASLSDRLRAGRRR